MGAPAVGYAVGEMAAVSTSELRIPADPSYIVVAKRAVAGFGCVAGSGYLASPAIGVVHPVADALVIALLQAGGAYVTAPENPAGRTRR